VRPIAGFDLYASQGGSLALGGLVEQQAQQEWSNARAAARGYQLARGGQLQGQATADQGRANAFSALAGAAGSALGGIASAGIRQLQLPAPPPASTGVSSAAVPSWAPPAGYWSQPPSVPASVWRDPLARAW
jgi:hypothetical protein